MRSSAAGHERALRRARHLPRGVTLGPGVREAFRRSRRSSEVAAAAVDADGLVAVGGGRRDRHGQGSSAGTALEVVADPDDVLRALSGHPCSGCATRRRKLGTGRERRGMPPRIVLGARAERSSSPRGEAQSAPAPVGRALSPTRAEAFCVKAATRRVQAERPREQRLDRPLGPGGRSGGRMTSTGTARLLEGALHAGQALGLTGLPLAHAIAQVLSRRLWPAARRHGRVHPHARAFRFRDRPSPASRSSASPRRWASSTPATACGGLARLRRLRAVARIRRPVPRNCAGCIHSRGRGRRRVRSRIRRYADREDVLAILGRIWWLRLRALRHCLRTPRRRARALRPFSPQEPVRVLGTLDSP